jgi:hypothetical protein
VPSLDKSTVDLLAVLGVVVGGVALLVAAVVMAQLRRLRRDYDVLQAGGSRESLVAHLGRQRATVDALQDELGSIRGELVAARTEIADAIRHVAVLRYDAFADMGGRLSFSAALLDDSGDGIVVTSINGRSETRTYAKGVKAGASEHTLSPEEQQAIAYAQGRVPARATRRSARRPAAGDATTSTASAEGGSDSVEGFTVLP